MNKELIQELESVLAKLKAEGDPNGKEFKEMYQKVVTKAGRKEQLRKQWGDAMLLASQRFDAKQGKVNATNIPEILKAKGWVRFMSDGDIDGYRNSAPKTTMAVLVNKKDSTFEMVQVKDGGIRKMTLPRAFNKLNETIEKNQGR